MDESRARRYDVDDALLSGVLADQVIGGLRRGQLDNEGRSAAEALARFVSLAIAFRTGELSGITEREMPASTAYSLFARAAAHTPGSIGGMSALHRYRDLLRRARGGQLPVAERDELEKFLDTVATVSLDSARGKVGALLGNVEDRARRPWTRS